MPDQENRLIRRKKLHKRRVPVRVVYRTLRSKYTSRLAVFVFQKQWFASFLAAFDDSSCRGRHSIFVNICLSSAPMWTDRRCVSHSGLEPAGAGNHRSDGNQANHPLTLKRDHLRGRLRNPRRPMSRQIPHAGTALSPCRTAPFLQGNRPLVSCDRSSQGHRARQTLCPDPDRDHPQGKSL